MRYILFLLMLFLSSNLIFGQTSRSKSINEKDCSEISSDISKMENQLQNLIDRKAIIISQSPIDVSQNELIEKRIIQTEELLNKYKKVKMAKCEKTQEKKELPRE